MDEYLCLNCYNVIVVNRASAYVEHAAEWSKGLKRCSNDNLSMSKSISLLTNIIFEREIIVDCVNILTKLLYNKEKSKQKLVIYSFKQLQREIVAKDFRLSSFFNSIYNASLSENRTTFKKDISLFVDLIGVSMEAINTLLYADTKKLNLKEFFDTNDDSPQDQKILDEDNILGVL
ncbi:31850_t:CDS:2 [Gigaspora margarita]|uniref:31850_t:CDS:1 n=1 Tax=Gigaspora margarita TaxID=4874 RepID=A0ABN7UIL9_GIGMA|nr:31850_t:CDS:2 [Gigaspora margarita]